MQPAPTLSKLECPDSLVASLVLNHDRPARTYLQAFSTVGPSAQLRKNHSWADAYANYFFKNLSGCSPLQMESTEEICSDVSVHLPIKNFP